MSRIHAKATDFYVDEFDFGTFTNAVDIDVDNGLADVTAFADTDFTFIEGKPSFTINVGGLWTPTAGSYDAEMFTDLTAVERQLGVYPPGATDGVFGLEALSNVGSQNRPTQFSAAVLLDVSWQGTDLLVRTMVSKIDTALAASVNGSGSQFGGVTAGTNKIVGVVRLLAAPGGAGNNTLDWDIESDDNSGFISATVRASGTQLDQTSVATHEKVEYATTQADDYWRIAFTYAGAGSRTFSVVATLGLADDRT